MEALESRLDHVVEAIMKAPARDLTALALKANAVARTWPELWELTPDELDHPEELLRDLIENVCAVAGVDSLHQSAPQATHRLELKDARPCAGCARAGVKPSDEARRFTQAGFSVSAAAYFFLSNVLVAALRSHSSLVI